MQAIILAAGMGKRLKELTRSNTKCMVEVNGVTLIERMLHQLQEKALSQIVIVVGYEGQKLMDYIQTLDICTPIVFVQNPVYQKTNNIYSLYLAREYLCREDTLLLESDLIFEDAVLDALLDDPRDTLALVDRYESWMDGTCVTLNEDSTIKAFIPGNKFRFSEAADYYKTVNIYKFGRQFSQKYYVPFLEAYQAALGVNEYYEQVLRVIAMLDDSGLKAKKLSGQRWYEIDDVQDLDIAQSMFHPDENGRAALIQQRYGGYWRYPQLLDFCRPASPYFPPQRMMDEIKASFEKLLTQYPSGMRVNALLAAKNFDLPPENILVGNGAAELIKTLMARLEGRLGIVRPTFEEYSQRYAGGQVVSYWPGREGFRYSAEELMRFFDRHPVEHLVLINPDNPSGNTLSRAGLQKLIGWAKKAGTTLIVDESFADFAEEPCTLLERGLLKENPHLYVIKSISKSFGVPGLRLGVLASGNAAAIAGLKTEVSIWNINSFAEFYMQIEEKYKKDYAASLIKLKAERARYAKKLSKIGGLRVFPSGANYLMVQLTGGVSAAALTRRLLVRHRILVKDLSGKLGPDAGQYLRLAVRNTEENDRLVGAICSELGTAPQLPPHSKKASAHAEKGGQP